jgi:hypothetical protein
MNDVRCLRCGTLLISGDCLKQIHEKIADENFSIAELVVDCPKCQRGFGLVMACDSTGLIVLLVPPEKTKKCFNELRQMLEGGLTITTIAEITSNAKKSEYISSWDNEA